MVTITERLQSALKRHQDEKPELSGKNVRIAVDGETLSEESFTVGFDANPAGESDTVMDLAPLTVVMDPNTQKHLDGATIDIDESGISISFAKGD